MAWIKVPKENHPLFHAALPKDRRITTLLMFGGVAAKVNGHMFAGLFARSAIVRLSPGDQARALALDGAGWFDPMGNGRVSKETVQLPDDVMEDPAELRDWLQRAFDHAITLPAKPAKGAKPAKAAKAKAPTKTKAPAKTKAATKPAKPAKRKPKRTAR